MAITKFLPPNVPFSASSELRAFLDDQQKRLAPLVNNAAQRIEDEIITGDWQFSGNIGFYGTAPIAQQTGVAVTAAGIHAALVNLGLIT